MSAVSPVPVSPTKPYERVLSWARRNERWLSAVFFAFGFLDHLVTFGAFSLPIEINIFEAYLAFAALCILITHASIGKPRKIMRALSVAAPLFGQLTIGGILAGFVIFYTKSSALSVSWPFLILLTIVFLGSEILRDYRSHLVFQLTLFYFSLYALAIFALPTYLHVLNQRTFFESPILSICLFGLFVFILGLLGRKRLREALRGIFLSTGLLTASICAAYISHTIPPLPLALREGGIYHSIQHQGDSYTVQGEYMAPWWHILPYVVHHVSATPLYAYSAVFAPGAFTTNVVHEWQFYDPSTKSWITESTVTFAVSGGREEGYRGYSRKSNLQPGRWRVLVKTMNGQVIGQLSFIIENAEQEPPMQIRIL